MTEAEAGPRPPVGRLRYGTARMAALPSHDADSVVEVLTHSTYLGSIRKGLSVTGVYGAVPSSATLIALTGDAACDDRSSEDSRARSRPPCIPAMFRCGRYVRALSKGSVKTTGVARGRSLH